MNEGGGVDEVDKDEVFLMANWQVVLNFQCHVLIIGIKSGGQGAAPLQKIGQWNCVMIKLAHIRFLSKSIYKFVDVL